MILFTACNDHHHIIGKIVFNNVFIGYFTFHRKTGLQSVQSVLSLKKSCNNERKNTRQKRDKHLKKQK